MPFTDINTEDRLVQATLSITLKSGSAGENDFAWHE